MRLFRFWLIIEIDKNYFTSNEFDIIELSLVSTNLYVPFSLISLEGIINWKSLCPLIVYGTETHFKDIQENHK